MFAWKKYVCLLACAVVLGFAGCGGPSSEPVEVDQGMSVEELIKQDLQMTVDNGQLGSEMMSIQNNLEKLKATDPAKAEELMKDLEELQGAQGASAKSKAQAMIQKL